MDKDLHEQMVRDLNIQKSLDGNWKISKHQVKDVLKEINLRIIEYIQQFPFSLEHLALQTIQDFKQYLIPLQFRQENKKSWTYNVNVNMPIAMLHDGTLIYADLVTYVRQDFKDKPIEVLAVMKIFGTEKAKTILGG